MQVWYHCGVFSAFFKKSALENAFDLFIDERRMEKGRQEGRVDEAGRHEEGGKEGGKSLSLPALTVVAPACAMETQEGISLQLEFCLMAHSPKRRFITPLTEKEPLEHFSLALGTVSKDALLGCLCALGSLCKGSKLTKRSQIEQKGCNV